MAQTFDPVKLDIIWTRLLAIVQEAAVTLMRTGFTPVVSECGDLACGLFDTSGKMVCQSVTGPPGHSYPMATGVQTLLRNFPLDRFNDGDILVTNDPWMFTGHLHDVTLVAPIFHGGGVAGISACTAHWVDIGGRVFSADATEVFEEGLHLPPLKLLDQGKENSDVVSIIQHNVRMPQLVIGDLRAQVVATELVGRRARALLREFDLESIDQVADPICSRTEAALRRRLREVPEGVYENEVEMDGEEIPIKIKVQVRIQDSDVVVDFSGTSKQVRRGINCVENFTVAYSTYGIKCVLYPELPNNDGTFRPLEYVIPRGSILNADPPAPLCARHVTAHYLPGAIFGALARAVPEKVMAESGLSGGPIQFDGFQEDGRRFVCTILSSSGFGARPTADGLPATAFPTNYFNTPIEIIENTASLLVLQRELACDSGGPGRFVGGSGQSQVFEVLGSHPVVLSCMFERTRVPAHGYAGGQDGSRTELVVDEQFRPDPKLKCVVKPGSKVTVKTAGGGGVFPPDERPPEQVLEDVQDGLISLESAEKNYRVAIQSDLVEVDWARTASLRTGLRGKGPEEME